MNNKKTDIVLNILFVLFLLLVLANRFLLYFFLNFDYIDSDQPLMWLATEDYSKGLFYEPRFYGQNYNTMLEAFFAVPFYKMGIPAYECVPAITHTLAIFPFVFASCYLFLRKEKTNALAFLGGFLCLTTGFDIVTGIPRGFVTGIFFTSFFVVSLYNPKNYFYLLYNCFLAYVAYLVNPNSVLVSITCLFYLWLQNYSEKKFYLFAFVGFLLATPIDYGLNHFYKIHPNYIVHGAEDYFSFTFFTDALKNLSSHFMQVSWFIEQQSYSFFLLTILSLLILFRKNKPAFYSALMLLLIVAGSFLYSKSKDGSVWAFYSYSRIYIAVPFTLFLFLFLIKITPNKFFYIFIAVVFIFCGYKFSHLKSNISLHTNEKLRNHLQMTSLKELKQTLMYCKIDADKNNVSDLVFVESYWHQDFIIYAGSVLIDDFPRTLNPHYDRRYWRLQEENVSIRSRFLLYCGDNAFFNTHKIPSGTLTKINDWGLYLVSDNKLTAIDFLKKTGFNVIPFKD